MIRKNLNLWIRFAIILFILLPVNYLSISASCQQDTFQKQTQPSNSLYIRHPVL